jgi:hypothetical protein
MIPVNNFNFALVVMLAVFGICYLVTRILNRIKGYPPRRKPMTKVKFTKDDFVSTQPEAVAGDAQSSLNDYNGEREQDQAIAQLVAQLDAMGDYLWTQAIPQGFGEKGEGMSKLAQFSWLMSAISLPMAAVAEVRNNSAAGSQHYVQAGNRRIACAGKAEAAQVADDITKGTWRVLAPLRALYLLNIRAIASGEGAGADPKSWVTFSCGNQHAAKAPDQDSANGYVEALNEVYLDAINDVRNDIMMELLAVAGDR